MSQHLHGVAVYNPDLLSKEELLRLFVARQPLLARLVRDVRAETGGLPQHHLIVGRRGMGKTTLLRRLRYAIEDDPELDARWLPLVFPEEQYNVANLSDFWLNCVDALADALESRGQRESLAVLDEQVGEIASIADEGDRRARALGLLLSLTDRIARRLVLLIDNLDLVFARLEQDDWAVRETLSREPRLLLIGATSQALESSFRYDKAFYDFFRIHELDGLDEAQTFEVMRHLAEVTEQPRVLHVIEHQPGRIQTLRLLSGGNPRTLILLFNLLAQGTEGDARSDLERLLDQITPLYKHRFEELPAQAQRVVDGLALGWDPMTARELANRLRLDINQTSAQLNRLVKQGVVEKTRLPGKSRTGFQLSERFFNIWYLMRASRRMRRRLIFLVKFLELFFPPEALRAQAMRRLRAHDGSLDADYGFALAQAIDDAGLRHALETHSLRSALADPRAELSAILDLDGEDRALATRAERIKALVEAERAVLTAERTWPEGLNAIRFSNLLGGSLSISAGAKLSIAASVSELSDWQIAEVCKILETERHGWTALCGSAVAVDDARAFVRRGYVEPNFISGGMVFASNDIEGILASGGFSEACSFILTLHGNGLLSTSRVDEAEAAYRRAIDIAPNFAYPWNGLANLLMNYLSRFDEAEAAYRRAIEIEPNVAHPWNGLANLLQDHLSRFDEAEAAYRRAIGIDPNDEYPWNGLANLLQDHLSRFDEAEAAYRRAIEIDPNFANPWNGLANLLQNHLSRFDEAEAAYRRAIDIDPNYAYAWSGLANLLQNHLSRFDEAETAYRRALDLAPNAPQILNGYAWKLYIHDRDLDAAEHAARAAVDSSPNDPFYTHTLACIEAARGVWPAELAGQFLSDERSRQKFWNDILIFFSEVVRHGHAARARALLLSLPEPEAWTPLVAALEAIEHENSELLLALSPEMRSAVELVLSRIAPEFAR